MGAGLRRFSIRIGGAVALSGRSAGAGGVTRVIGAVGVIGPTRLNYARVVPMVDYTARIVGSLVG